MKKSTLIRMSCLCVALVVLVSALAVAAFNGSPYETLKNALLDAATLQNATVNLEARMSINGEAAAINKTYAAWNDNAAFDQFFDTDGQPSGYNYRSNKLYLSPDYLAADGTQWYNAHVNRGNFNTVRSMGNVLGIGGLSAETRDSAYFRFATLALDALVGDLKNNIVMSEENGIRHISGTLTSVQMPELIRAGIDMVVETSQGSSRYNESISVDHTTGVRMLERTTFSDTQKTVYLYKQTFEAVEDESTFNYDKEFYGFFYEYDADGEESMYAILSETLVEERTEPASSSDYSEKLYEVPISKVNVNYVHGEADVDSNGNLLGVSINGTASITTIFGEVYEMDISVNLDISDIGNSIPVCPVPGAEDVLTADFISRKLGADFNGNFYFRLLPDGTVDTDSITTTWPGERNDKPLPGASALDIDSIGVIGGADGPTTIIVK